MKTLETIKKYYPSINGDEKKIKQLIKEYGESVIKDMYPRAEKIKHYRLLMKATQNRINDLLDLVLWDTEHYAENIKKIARNQRFFNDYKKKYLSLIKGETVNDL